MKRKLFSLLLCFAMVLSLAAGCGVGGTGETVDNPPDGTPVVDTQGGDNSQIETEYTGDGRQVSDETELYYLFSGEVTDWNYLVATSNTPAMYIDSLVEYDYLGLCKPCLAESWTRSEDGLVWTFKIRQGVKWLTYQKEEYADVTAYDWETSCKYILDPANASRLADMMFTLKGAEAYYDKMAGGDTSADFSAVGVKALDAYTLQYTLEAPVPYFLSSLTYKNFFPANAQWIEECGDQFSTDNQTMLYCGEFVMTEYVPQQIIVSELTPNYWDIKNMHVTKITEIYNAEAGTVEPEMFLRGEVNYCEVPTEQLDEWLNDPAKYELIRPCRPSFYTYSYYFNFYPNFDEKYEPDNWKLAVNNVNFRKSILHALDKVALVEIDDPYNADAHVQNTMTPADFISASGVDYTRLDALKDWAEKDTYDVELAKGYRETAIQELTAAGATFPIIVYCPYNTGSTYDTQRAQVFEQMLERNLGTEYIDIQLEGYPDSDYSNTTLRAGNYCIQRSSWMADYLDPLSYTDPFRIVQNRTNFIYMAEGLMQVSDTQVEGSKQGKDGRWYYDIVYDDMVDAANSEYIDLTKRYNDFAVCENWLVNEMCLAMPYMRGGTGYIGSSLMPFESQYAAFGASDGRYKYQYIYTDGINTEEYYTAYEAWQKERADAIAQLDAQGKVFGIDY